MPVLSKDSKLELYGFYEENGIADKAKIYKGKTNTSSYDAMRANDRHENFAMLKNGC